MLGQVNEKKVAHLLCQRHALNGIDNQAQMHATADAAIKAGVSIWTVDARGLVAQVRHWAMRRRARRATRACTPARRRRRSPATSSSRRTRSTRWPATRAARRSSTTTIFRAALCRRSRRFRTTTFSATTPRIRPERQIPAHSHFALANNQDAKLDYRQGYYADKEFSKFNDVDRERQLEDALMLEDPITDLTIAMEIDYFQLNRAEYFVPIVVKIPGRELALAKRGGAEHTLIDFVGEIKDLVGGTTVEQRARQREHQAVRRDGAELAKRPIEYDTGFTLLPGKYSIKFLARDDETGRIGTFRPRSSFPI
jgi:hypothetical protein